MTKYNAMRYFKTKEEAEAFAKAVGSDSWGCEKNINGEIVKWYVDYNV